MKIKPSSVALMILATAAMTLAGCGNNSSATAPASASSPNAPQPASPPAAANAGAPAANTNAATTKTPD